MRLSLITFDVVIRTLHRVIIIFNWVISWEWNLILVKTLWGNQYFMRTIKIFAGVIRIYDGAIRNF